MKKLALLLPVICGGFLLFSFPCQAQTSPVNPIKQLARQITKGKKNERQKTKAIFDWIANNIAYDVALSDKISAGKKKYSRLKVPPATTVAQYRKDYNEALVKLVLKRKKAICDGYSRLFKTLCDYSGIEANIISGVAKGSLDSKPDSHAWNGVKLGGKWYLLDPTWASGYVNLGDVFVKKYNDFYYLTDPEKLVVDHLPNELKWTLLDKKKSLELFSASPVKTSNVFAQGNLVDFYPKGKTVKPNKDDILEIWFEFKSDPDKKIINVMEAQIETLGTMSGLSNAQIDSAAKVNLDIMRRIPKTRIIDRKVVGNKVHLFIKLLTPRPERILVYIDNAFPSLEYKVGQ